MSYTMFLSVTGLPIPMYGASTLAHADTFIMIGGHHDAGDYDYLDTVYRFRGPQEDSVLWETLSLAPGRAYHQAMYVDVLALPKCD